MSRGTHIIFLAVIAFVGFSSCNITRHVPAGSYLLKQNVIEIDKSSPREDRIPAAQLEKYVRQSPNKKFLGTNAYIWVYSLSNPNKKNWLNNTLRKIGQQPVILDTADVRRSVSNMKLYMNSRGFFSASEDYTIDSAKKKATVVYQTHQGIPYRIGTITYDYKDKIIKSVIENDSSSTLLVSGNIFDIGVLDKERVRITNYLKNLGYYKFEVSSISYVADSMVGDHKVNLTMIIKQYVSGYNDNGQPIYVNNSIYRLNNIMMYSNYNPTLAASDKNYIKSLDTAEYRGLGIVYDKRLHIRENVLRGITDLYPNHIYSNKEVQKTYNNVMRLGYYKSANVLFTEDTTTKGNVVTYIGSSDAAANAESTTENYLNCTILCTPALRQSYKIELEASSTSNFYALTATVGYQNRNLFRGMEVFDISLRGGYEFMRVKGSRGSFEIGGTTSISFPRFIIPWASRLRNMSNPRTKFELSLNSQRRPYYHRTLSGATWGYSWSGGRFNNFTLRPVDISLVKMGYRDQDFFDNLKNPYLRKSYESQLIAGISGSWVYNNQIRDINSNALMLRLNWETMGNLFSGLTSLFSQRSPGEDYNKILGIRFAQYVRTEVSLSNKLVLGNKSSIVYRVLGGAGVSYGNSSSSSIPFDRLFYCGGSNGMRGWVARTLGPGNSPIADNTYPTQLGNLKLEANLETRFPIWGLIHGALFFDVGNIWYLRASEAEYPSGVFHFNSFLSQLGFNTGLGARFDLGFFVLRLDWGIKLHDPNQPSGKRWIHNLQMRNTTLNFGVGYPF